MPMVMAGMIPMNAPLPPPATTSSVAVDVVVRKEFPETWLWEDKNVDADGKSSFVSKIPDTITSWLVSAFAMDKESGLGLADEKAKVTVFRPFFVSLNLPYSIIRGEAIAIQVLVFNYQDENVDAEIVMENKMKEFVFTEATNEVSDQIGEDPHKTEMRRKVSVPANDAVSVSFLITPTKVGYIDIKVIGTATGAGGSLSGDAILKKLLVKPEGQTQYFNEAVLVNLGSNSTRLKRSVKIDTPEQIVPDSEYVAVSAIGDVLGPQVNSDNLLRMPYGCGEQNMVNFVPNIITLDYLTISSRLNDGQKQKAVKNMEAGYQRELTYQRDDGSFSAFGNSDSFGSTVLTAYVMKSFKQAEKYITIDKKVMERGIDFLMKRQVEDGSFTETGSLHSRELQGGISKSPAALTAYVLIAILQDVSSKSVYEAEIKNATNYLINKSKSSSDPYEVSIITYALHLADSEAKDEAYGKLTSLAKSSSGYTRGESAVAPVTSKSKYDYWNVPKSNDVEMTAYALSTMALRGQVEEAVPVLKWMVSKQNSDGGFSSTQDTVIGIQALADIAGKLSNADTNMKLTYKTDDGKGGAITVNKENSLVLQKIELARTVRSAEVEAEGTGVSVIQVLWHYNIANNTEEAPFKLRSEVSTVDLKSVSLRVCIRLNKQGSTGMAVMEVDAPSGYTIQSWGSNRNGIKRIDNENAGTRLIFYFDSITDEEMCLSMMNTKEFKVAKQKPVPIYAYDYYNRNLNTRIFYSIPETALCDICDGDDCKKC